MELLAILHQRAPCSIINTCFHRWSNSVEINEWKCFKKFFLVSKSLPSWNCSQFIINVLCVLPLTYVFSCWPNSVGSTLFEVNDLKCFKKFLLVSKSLPPLESFAIHHRQAPCPVINTCFPRWSSSVEVNERKCFKKFLSSTFPLVFNATKWQVEFQINFRTWYWMTSKLTQLCVWSPPIRSGSCKDPLVLSWDARTRFSQHLVGAEPCNQQTPGVFCSVVVSLTKFLATFGGPERGTSPEHPRATPSDWWNPRRVRASSACSSSPDWRPGSPSWSRTAWRSDLKREHVEETDVRRRNRTAGVPVRPVGLYLSAQAALDVGQRVAVRRQHFPEEGDVRDGET